MANEKEKREFCEICNKNQFNVEYKDPIKEFSECDDLGEGNEAKKVCPKCYNKWYSSLKKCYDEWKVKQISIDDVGSTTIIHEHKPVARPTNETSLYSYVFNNEELEEYNKYKALSSNKLTRSEENEISEANIKLKEKIIKLQDEKDKRVALLNATTSEKETKELEKLETASKTLKSQYEYQLKARETAILTAEKKIAEIKAKLEQELIEIERKTEDRKLAYETSLLKVESAKKPSVEKDKKVIIFNTEINRLNEKIQLNNDRVDAQYKIADLTQKYKTETLKCHLGVLRNIIKLVQEGSILTVLTPNEIFKWVCKYNKSDENIYETVRDDLILSDDDTFTIENFKRVDALFLL